MNQPIWGIDLGGTKIEGVILRSISDPSPIVRTRVDTEASKGYEHIVGQIARLVAEMERSSGLKPRAIGIGTPGVLDPTLQTMKNCNTVVLNGKPLKKDVENALQLTIEMANDANCFALAETQWGIVRQSAPGARLVFGIIMGTGVGGGIVMDGKIWNGRHGIAGEWGHNYLDESGGPCYCGKTGCVETVISGPATERYYKSLTGQQLKLKEIVARHKEGTDPAATKTMERLCHFFGKGVSVITNLLDPDVVVIGGGVGNIDLLYAAGLQELGRFIFNNRVEVPLLKPSLGDSAGVFGAAALVAGR
ncbi:MAG TPA: ROK family protein [Puia sp.]|uniref:ROK family protein n=1 Tax=Puia sp. TaxID=2045100 RepID=UPI002C53BD61|nr:ROK family protein [Puia sp.]HVU97221.1 ROK family protein [Puia sp.]